MVGLVVAVHAQEYVVFPWAPTGSGDSADNCGFSAVPVHLQGSCRGADADPHGLDCTAVHSNSPEQFLDKVIDGPVVQGVQVVDVTFVVPGPFPMVQTICRTKEIPLLLHKVIDVPVVQVVQLPGWWSRRA